MPETVMGKEFVLNDGKRISSIAELADAIEHMKEGVFRAHVSDIHNDFADWIEDAHDNRLLANELRVADNNMEIMESLRRHLSGQSEASKKAKQVIESTQEPEETSELIEEAAADSIPEFSAEIQTSTLADSHEEAAPTIQSEVHDSSEIAEDSQTIDAATIVPQDNIVEGDPSNAPIIEMGSKESASNDSLLPEAILPQTVTYEGATTQLPGAHSGMLPGPKMGINKSANPFLLQVMLIYRYLIMILSLGRIKLIVAEAQVQRPSPVLPTPLKAPQ